MLKFKPYEHIPNQVCDQKYFRKLRNLGFNTDGYIASLEKILTDNGFGLPTPCNGGFGFLVNYKYIKIYIHYVDALACEIIFLKELKLF